MAATPITGLLCLANFPSNTGYAWDFIESLYVGVGEKLKPSGFKTWIAYPAIDSPPRVLEGTETTPVEMSTDFSSPGSVLKLAIWIKKNEISVLYLADRPTWHLAYALLRVAGIRRIVVHDHTSGDRTPPTGLRRAVKRIRQKLPGCLVDHVVAVSDYVARRKVEVDLLPASRVTRIWNGVRLPVLDESLGSSARIREELGISEDRLLIMAIGRAVREKGLHYLFRGFDAAIELLPAEAPLPVLAYIGDGPFLSDLASLRNNLVHGANIQLVGHVPDASRLLVAADISVFPSTWGEAFGLGVLEPMSYGVPVIACNVGGVPEVLAHGQCGLVVPPKDVAAIANAIVALSIAPPRRLSLSKGAIARTKEHFLLDPAIGKIAELVSDGMVELADGARRDPDRNV